MVYNSSAIMGQHESIDSANTTLPDWFTVSLNLDPTKFEWCQDKGVLQKTKFWYTNVNGSSYGFTYNNFEFRGKNKRCLSKFPLWYDVESIWIVWRFQKMETIVKPIHII